MSVNGEDDENGGKVRGKPNAYFAKIKAEQEEELEAHERGDTFSGSYRGTKPPPHGGAAYVRADQVIGLDDLCWCGLPAGHDWPGKKVGAKHPKVEENSNVNVDTGTLPNLDRKDLRAFHRRLQDFVIQCVNTDEVRYRMTKNSVILYPPDGSAPMSVFARNTDRQLRQLQKWYIEHIYVEPKEEPVDEAALAKLAEAKNDPVEHPKPTPPRKDEVEVVQPPVYEVPVSTDEAEVESSNENWKPWIRSDHTESDKYEVNDDGQIRCRLCLAEGKTTILPGPRSTGGHYRTHHHEEAASMWTKEAREKATDTYRWRKRQVKQIDAAIELLIGVTGYNVVPEDTGRVAELEAEGKRLTERVAELEAQLAGLQKEAEEREAKLALIRETMGL